MPRNGSGLYTLPAGNPVVTQTLITSNWANTTLNDLAAAITQSLSRDGQSVPTANLPMGNFRIVGAGDPVGLQDYVNLRSLQLSQYNKLTSIAGTANDVSGNLPGGATSFQNGQTVLFTPLVDNTGPVTLTVNGSPPAPVVSASGAPLPAGALQDGLTYSLVWNNGSWFVSSAQGAGAFAAGQSAISGWVRPLSGSYPLLSVASSTSVGVPAGNGYVVAPSALDASAVVPVSWATQNVTITGLATGVLTTLGVNASGVIEQVPGVPEASWARTHVILGEAIHPKGTVAEVTTAPSIFADLGYLTWDIADMLRGFLISGGGMNGNTTNPLKFGLLSATLFGPGYTPNAIESPNKMNLAADPIVDFYPVTQNNAIGVITSDVPVTNYNPTAGTITQLPAATSATIHRLYWLGGTQFLFLYGQFVYDGLQKAIESISVDGAQTVFPASVNSAIFLGYIITQKNCTDLKNTSTAALLFAVPTLGGGIGSGGGGGIAFPGTATGWLRGDGVFSPNVVNSIALFVEAAAGGGRSIQLGSRRTADTVVSDGNNFIDFYSANTTDPATYHMRLIRWAGANGNAQWENRGNGDVIINGLGASTIRFRSSNIDKMAYNAATNLWEVPVSVGFTHSALNVNGAAGTARRMRVSTAGVVRWEWGGDGAAESGSNAGTNYILNRYNDAGTYLGTAITIPRATGVAAFEARPVFAGNTPWDSGNFNPASKADASALANYVLKSGDIMTGDLTFSGAGRRIKGDFNSAPQSNRTMFQTTAADATTGVSAIPSGTAQTALFSVYNSSDPNNAGSIQLRANPTDMAIESTNTGTGVLRDLHFKLAGITRGQFSAADGQLYLANGLNSPFVTAGLYQNTNGTAGEKYRIGNDASLYDIDRPHAIAVRSQTDQTQGEIQFGDGPSVRRSPTNGLYLDITGGLNLYAPGGSEGGEISLKGIGSNSDAVIDNLGELTRFFGGAAGPMEYNRSTGQLFAPGNIKAGGGVHCTNALTIGPDSDVALYHENDSLVVRAGAGGTKFWQFGSDAKFSGGQWSLRSDGTGNPALTHGNAVLNIDGAYGGGIRMKDGAVTAGMWLINTATLNFGVRATDTGLPTGAVLDANGNWSVAGNLSAGSDRRLKSDIRPLEDGADLVNRLLPKRYVKNGQEDLGFIAQDVLEVIPEAVTVPDDPEAMMALNYSAIIPALVGAVQSLTAEVKALREQIEKLEGK